MKFKLGVLVVWLGLFGGSVMAGDSFSSIGSAEIYLADSYAQKLRENGADFVIGNKISAASLSSSSDGWLRIILSSGAKNGQQSRRIIVIRLSDVLYVQGRERLVNF